MPPARVYSQTIFSVKDWADDFTIYAPLDHIWVVRCIDVYANANIAHTNVKVREGYTDACFFWARIGPAREDTVHWEGRQVIEVGHGLHITNDGHGADISISGYALLFID
jgi:hypothetical protein